MNSEHGDGKGVPFSKCTLNDRNSLLLLPGGLPVLLGVAIDDGDMTHRFRQCGIIKSNDAFPERRALVKT